MKKKLVVLTGAGISAESGIATFRDSGGLWDQRKSAVRKGGVKALADGNMGRWFTEEFKTVNPQRWKEIHSTICGTSDAGFLGCAAAIQNFDYLDRLATIAIPCSTVAAHLAGLASSPSAQ